MVTHSHSVAPQLSDGALELDVECWGADLGARVEALARERIARARPLTKTEVDARPLPVKLRDGLAWLLSPYL